MTSHYPRIWTPLPCSARPREWLAAMLVGLAVITAGWTNYAVAQDASTPAATDAPAAAASDDTPADPPAAERPESKGEVTDKAEDATQEENLDNNEDTSQAEDAAKPAPAKAPPTKAQWLAEFRETLELFGLPDHYSTITDGLPVADAEQEALAKFLHSARRLKPVEIIRPLIYFGPTDDMKNLDPLRQSPAEHRGNPLHLGGSVTEVVPVSPTALLIERFGIEGYYRCRIELEHNLGTAIVYALEVPREWLEGPVSKLASWSSTASGLFVKRGPDDTLVFVAKRMAWHPPGILGSTGMDMGLFDDVRNRTRLTSDDTACFYRLLATAGNINERKLAELTLVDWHAVAFKPQHLLDTRALVWKFQVEQQDDQPTPAKQLWSLFDDSLRTGLEQLELRGNPDANLKQQLIDGLNETLSSPQLFSAGAWRGRFLPPEGIKGLHAAVGKLDANQQALLHRHLLAALYPDWISKGGKVPLTPDQFSDLPAVTRELAEQLDGGSLTPAKWICRHLPAGLQAKLRSLGESPEGASPQAVEALGADVIAGLNTALTRVSLYELVVWKDVPVPAATEKLFTEAFARLSEADRKKLNRLLLETAYPNELRATVDRSPLPYLLEPDLCHGRLTSLTGTARRAVRIEVDDPDVRDRYNLSHYYEMEVILDVSGSDYVQKREPFVFCLRKLPKHMKEGEDIHYGVRVPAFFFKKWAYEVRESRPGVPAIGAARHRTAPMLIGHSAMLVTQDTHNPWYGAIAGGLFIVAVVGVWLGVWTYSRGDERFMKSTLSRNFEPQEGTSLNELGIEADDGPDFSKHGAEDGVEQPAEAEAATTETEPDAKADDQG